MFCAQGGSGKSSLLMGLVAAGWQAISEDQCIIDLDESGQPRVWPGPSWVCAKRGAPPPLLVGEPRFEALDKIAWDLDTWMAHSPARVARIMFLEPPGGDELLWEWLPSDAAVTRLVELATWFQNNDGFARAVLPQVVNLAMAVPAFRMRVPLRADWLTLAVAAVTDS
jgi:hypothetical protein